MSHASPLTVTSYRQLSASQIADVQALVDDAAEHDGVRPLSEHVWLHLVGGIEAYGLHLLVTQDAEVVGYAQLDLGDPVDGPSAELAVAPRARRIGVGRLLVAELIASSPDGRLRLWSHGQHSGAAELALGMGFRRSRVLWQMRASLTEPLPEILLPPGVEIRPFQVGHDEQQWLELNARAFADLPDQGRWTIDDLMLRIREPWFSALGFLVAWRAGRMVGFHWTKVHGRSGDRVHPHAEIGEVYVVGVDPRLHGEGLGRALTIAGLEHLRSLDLQTAMLYVDETNSPAISLYQSLGFTRWDVDELFARDPST